MLAQFISSFLLGVMVGFCLLVLSLGPWLKSHSEKKTPILLDGKKYRVEEINGEFK